MMSSLIELIAKPAKYKRPALRKDTGAGLCSVMISLGKSSKPARNYAAQIIKESRAQHD